MPSLLPAMQSSFHSEIVRESFVFDPGDYYFMFLFKGFNQRNFLSQELNCRMLCEFGLLPSVKLLFHSKWVKPTHHLYFDIRSYDSFLSKMPTNYFMPTTYNVTKLFQFCVADKSNWLSSKEGESVNIFVSLQILCGPNILGNVFSRCINKRLIDIKDFS